MKVYIKRKYKTMILITVLLALAITPTVIVSTQLRQISKQQTDTLNTLMEIDSLTLDCDTVNSEADKFLNESEKILTIECRELVEGVVASEARGDTLDGMIAVAQTIKDRGDLWDMEYDEVVIAPGQYAEPYTGFISDKVKLAVELVFDYGFRISEEPITHFHSFGEGKNPYWAEAKVCRGSLGSLSHQFYY